MNITSTPYTNLTPTVVGGNTYGGLTCDSAGIYYIEGVVNVEENGGSQDLGATIVKLVKTSNTNNYLSAGRTKVTGSTSSHQCAAKVYWCGQLSDGDVIALYTFASSTNQHYIRSAHLIGYKLQ